MGYATKIVDAKREVVEYCYVYDRPYSTYIGQAMQPVDDSRVVNLPASHVMHERAPVVFVYDPAGHTSQ